MTRILAIADEVDEGLYGEKLRRLRPDLVLSAGDLSFDYLEYIVSRLDVPLLYVPGNHDPELRSAAPTWEPMRAATPKLGPQGCDNVDGRVIAAAGLRVAGLGGSMRYRPGPNQYSDSEMRWRAMSLELRIKLNPARSARRLDVLITHAPPPGVGPPEDLAHRGFTAFAALTKNLAPKVLIHGHVHPFGRSKPELQMGSTRIVNAVPWRMVEI